MRRLADGRDALSLLDSGELGDAHLDAVAALVAGFHARVGLGQPAPFAADEWRERVSRPVLANFASLAESKLPEIDPAWLARVEDAARAWLEDAAERIEARRRGMRIVEGHGDLHLAHVWFEAGPERPLLVDCIEFNEDLRRIDAASEVAFLAMDLAYRGRFRLAERLLRVYAREADDFGLYGVVDGFASYRAAVRAKVAALAARDTAIEPEQRAAATRSAVDHLALAEALLRPRRAAGLVVLCGIVGTGKSTVAEAVAAEVGGVAISSDRTRKRLAGLAPTDRAGAEPEGGIYDRATSDAVYAGLLERAAALVEAGRTAVLDASHATRGRREAARAWALARGLPALLVEVRCRRDTALARLARREAEGRDPSDAGPALYEFSARRFEPPDEWPRPLRAVVSTDDDAWRTQLPEFGARLR
jgi:predicted kinase